MTQSELIAGAVALLGTEAAVALAMHTTPQKVNDYRHRRRPLPPDQAALLAWLTGNDPARELAEATMRGLEPGRAERLAVIFAIPLPLAQ